MTDEKKTVKVAYRPQPGDPETTEVYGRKFKAGEFVELDDEFVARARNNPSFEVEGEKSYGDKRDEEAKQEAEADEAEELSFDEAVARETAAEYGTDDPELAEQLRRAREHNRDLAGVSRVEAQIAVAKKRGRPKKDTPPVDDDAKARANEVEADNADIERQRTEEARIASERQEAVERDRAAQQQAGIVR